MTGPLADEQTRNNVTSESESVKSLYRTTNLKTTVTQTRISLKENIAQNYYSESSSYSESLALSHSP